MKIRKILITFSVICFFFYIEALIHYNMGKDDKISLQIPEFNKNLKIISIIIFFSSCSTMTIWYIKKTFLN